MEKKNLVCYDWFSFTHKTMTVEDMQKIIGLSHVSWDDGKGARGYKSRKWFGGVSIHYDGRDDMGIWCEMSGQGCRTFETYSTLEWDGLFSAVLALNCKPTRLDVAFDDHTGILDMRRLILDTQDLRWVSRSTYWETVLSSKGSSIYIGSPQSDVRIRLYNKAAEKNLLPDEHWVRVELQLRDDRAKRFLLLHDLTIGEAFSGVLLNYLRYVVEDSDDSNKWRWPMADYWVNLLEILTPISIYSSPGVEYNLERCASYVFDQAGNAIDCYIKCMGINDFLQKLRNREVSNNPKYEQLIKLYSFGNGFFDKV